MNSAIRVSAGVLTCGQRLLICQRRAQDPHPGKWEFPGGKAQEGEDDAACLRRELREELGIDATVGVELQRATYTRHLHLYQRPDRGADLLFRAGLYRRAHEHPVSDACVGRARSVTLV
ncbi:MAG: NUDIX domain-containing protein [Deltaproteobacteria bacterium]|nr:MAG: NUDIX domain-containing protein [Deltaproteobacteria bacterium]